MRASITRQGDGTYRVLIEGTVGVLLAINSQQPDASGVLCRYAASLADAMALAYQLSLSCTPS